MNLVDALRSVVPVSIKRPLREMHMRRTFDSALARFERSSASGDVPREVLDDLVYGWGNEGWSVQHEYMNEVVRAVRTTKGSILECGSGLSTLLMCRMLGPRRNQLWSLENSSEWADRIRGMCQQHDAAGSSPST